MGWAGIVAFFLLEEGGGDGGVGSDGLDVDWGLVVDVFFFLLGEGGEAGGVRDELGGDEDCGVVFLVFVGVSDDGGVGL